MISAAMFLPSWLACSMALLMLRTSASALMVVACASGSRRAWTDAAMNGPLKSMLSILARMTPWTRMRSRPSGSLSIRMMMPTVPIR